MRKLIFVIVFIILSFIVSAEYLIIARNTEMDYENLNLYHYDVFNETGKLIIMK
ncbi:hypothetical protein KAU15_07515 [candidate division WOR-3 bacterium]|nr:hypothetical protein [candidate division WOR-3 bacterium]